MRWELLFADLETRLAAEDALARDAEAADLARAEQAALTLADRLRAHVGRHVVLRQVTGPLGVTVLGAGSDVLVAADVRGRRVLVPYVAIAAVGGLSRGTRPEPSPVLSRLGLRHALRALATAATEIRVATAAGDVRGLLRRVAADHIDVAAWDSGELGGLPHPGEAVPLAAVTAVWAATGGGPG